MTWIITVATEFVADFISKWLVELVTEVIVGFVREIVIVAIAAWIGENIAQLMALLAAYLKTLVPAFN
ncbi:MAG: hypothetical protein MUD14_23365 [Hydrococcus sp. Prado102]|jgi:hypothetical protein|nr:hypothetical protein [Hydrococcus sp. Prado102]